MIPKNAVVNIPNLYLVKSITLTLMINVNHCSSLQNNQTIFMNFPVNSPDPT